MGKTKLEITRMNTRKPNPFAPNPLAKAMGFTAPALPVDDFTAQCAAMTPQQQDVLLFLLSQMASVSRPQGGKP